MAEHFCKEHKIVWFKKGKMKGFAHPILDEYGDPTGKWCNEPKQEEQPQEEAYPDIEAKSKASSNPPSRGYQDSPEKIASIESQVAANITRDLVLAGKATPALEAGLYRWLEARLGVKPTRDTNQQPTSPPAAIVDAPVAEKVVVQGIPKTLQELMTWVSGHGKTYGPGWVCKQLNAKAATEIKDIQRAYEEIKQITGWLD